MICEQVYSAGQRQCYCVQTESFSPINDTGQVNEVKHNITEKEDSVIPSRSRHLGFLSRHQSTATTTRDTTAATADNISTGVKCHCSVSKCPEIPGLIRFLPDQLMSRHSN